MENTEKQDDLFGKKIFFLHPPLLVQNKLMQELAQQEYEVYSVKDANKFRKVLKKYPNSLVFINIDDGMPEKDWEVYIHSLLKQDEKPSHNIGVISASSDENLQKKYINNIKVTCGFTHIKNDIDKSTKTIIEILNSHNAKGRRKYIRATMDNETNATLNVPYNSSYLNGNIRDISVMGLSCRFEVDPEWKKNSYFQNIQLKLQSMLLKVEGIVFGSRMENIDKVYVLVFTQKVDPDTRNKIRKYIRTSLQNKMDEELR